MVSQQTKVDYMRDEQQDQDRIHKRLKLTLECGLKKGIDLINLISKFTITIGTEKNDVKCKQQIQALNGSSGSEDDDVSDEAHRSKKRRKYAKSKETVSTLY